MGARRYTDQEFRDAVADPRCAPSPASAVASASFPRGGNYTSLRAHALRLGVELPAASRRTPVARQHRRGPVPACSDEELLATIAEPQVDSYQALCTALGLRPHSNTYRRLRERAAALGTPLSAAWSRTAPRLATASTGGRFRFDTEALAAALSVARTRREALEFLGAEVTGSTYRQLAKQLEREGLDASHLHPHALRAVPLRELLVAGRHVARTTHLRRRLIAEGVLPPRCARCDRDTREGVPIPLELDHIDGDRTNDLLENLRLLCPNCHALTPTYRRNIGRNDRAGHTGVGPTG